jgi:DNA invertase Pin-like site-specific DNA recombinase
VFNKQAFIKHAIIGRIKMKSEKTRAALYVRVSTRDKRQETANQLRQLRELARRQGWHVVNEFVDRESGGKANRPQFARMFEDAAERKFDLLLFWSLDRFSREGVSRTFAYLERLKSNGVDWWSLKEEYLRSIGPFADAVLAILAVVAKQERVRISERVLAGLERARSEGKRLGRPFADFDTREARRLRRQGASLRVIAKAMGVCPATVLNRLAS